MQVSIRPANLGDSSAITDLSIQLGYSPGINDTSAYLQSLITSNNEMVFVALKENAVIGWMQLSYVLRLESGPFVEITGLIVSEVYRGKGVGKLFLAKAKDWCLQMKAGKLRVRCNVIRIDAHRFYVDAGFREVKEQKVFEILI